MLYLLPNSLSPEAPTNLLPQVLQEIVPELKGLIAESEKEGRRFLRRYLTLERAREIPIALCNEHTREDEFSFLLQPLRAGETWGLVSDGGLPCIADPGSQLVLQARRLKIPIIAYPGPSSILLALMQSGIRGERFAFHGYIAKAPEQRKKELAAWQSRAKRENETQIFIEAPYRSLHSFNALLEVLEPERLLCIAAELTESTQWVATHSIRAWHKLPPPEIDKKPVVYIFV